MGIVTKRTSSRDDYFQPPLAWSKSQNDCPIDADVTYVPTAVGNREWIPPNLSIVPFEIEGKVSTDNNAGSSYLLAGFSNFFRRLSNDFCS